MVLFYEEYIQKYLTEKKESDNFSCRQCKQECDCARDHRQGHLHFLELLLKYASELFWKRNTAKDGVGAAGVGGGNPCMWLRLFFLNNVYFDEDLQAISN